MEESEFIADPVMVILAAGLGTRMKGRSKPDLPWDEDGTLVDHQRATVHRMGLVSVVVARQGQERDQVVMNPHPERGIAESLKLGVHAVRMRYGPVAIGMLLADQPFITSEDITVVWRAFTNRAVHVHGVRARYDGTPGHPVFFDSALDGAIDQLSMDRGLGSIWNRREDTIDVDVPFGGRPNPAFDIDTAEDYALAQLWVAEGRG